MKEIKKILLALAEYYNQELTESQLAMYAEDLSDCEPSELIEATKVYRRDPKNTRFPLPAALVAIINPPVSDQDTAVDLASRICTAIVKRGYTWADLYRYDGHQSFNDALRAEFGDAGVEVIRRSGGWLQVHDQYFQSEPGIFRAQIRNQIESTMRLSRAGSLHHRPALPGPRSIVAGLIPNKGTGTE